MIVAILGAGPHGRQLQDLIPQSKLYDDEIPAYRNIEVGARNHVWIVGAAWPIVRRNVVMRLKNMYGRNPAAMFNEKYGEGSFVFPSAVIGHDVVIKDHAHVEFNATISHGCTIGNFVTICPNVGLAGEVSVSDGAFIGIGANVIHGGITIGQGAIVGAGAVVVDDVPAFSVVAGSPARHIRDITDRPISGYFSY